MLFVKDKQELPLVFINPVGSNHNDLFEVEKSVFKIVTGLNNSQISCDGVFMNTDTGFDCLDLRTLCGPLESIPKIDIN